MQIEKRHWYIIAAVIVILIIGYALEWFGGSSEPEPEAQQEEQAQ